MGLNEKYQQFLLDNSSLLAHVEGGLRSISYLIPGRFSDSEFAAEVLYSALNLLRLANDSTILRKGKIVGEGITRGAWNAYIGFLRRQSKLMDFLLTFLNVAWTVEVPLEMLVQRLLGVSNKLRFVLILELLKALAKFVVFWKSNWRPLLRNYLPDVSIDGRKSGKVVTKGHEDQEMFLTEIKIADQKEADSLRSFLRQHRIDQFILVPELSVLPAAVGLDKLREICHVLRPAVYALLLYIGRDGPKTRWTAWGLTLLMDVFSEWSQISTLLNRGGDSEQSKAKKLSPMERDERQVRLLKLLLYLLKEPFYTNASKGYIDSVIDTISTWRILRPATETAKSYQRLCEKVIYYTLGS